MLRAAHAVTLVSWFAGGLACGGGEGVLDLCASGEVANAPPGPRAVFQLARRSDARSALYVVGLDAPPFGCPATVTRATFTAVSHGSPDRDPGQAYWWLDPTTLLYWADPGRFFVVDLRGPTPDAPAEVDLAAGPPTPSPSPDGRWFTTGGGGSGLHFVPVREGVPGAPITRKAPSPVYLRDGAWRPDSRDLVAGGDSGLYRFHVDGDSIAEPEALPAPIPGEPFEATWSPDGRYLAFVVYDLGRASLAVIDFAGTAPTSARIVTTVASTGSSAIFVWSPDSRRILFRGDQPVGEYVVDVTDDPATPELAIGDVAEPGFFDFGWVDAAHVYYSIPAYPGPDTGFVVDVSSDPPSAPRSIMGAAGGRALVLSPDRRQFAFAQIVAGSPAAPTYAPFVVSATDPTAPLQLGHDLPPGEPIELRFATSSTWLLYRLNERGGLTSLWAMTAVGQPHQARVLPVALEIIAGVGDRFLVRNSADDPGSTSQLAWVGGKAGQLPADATPLVDVPDGYTVISAKWAPDLDVALPP